MPWNNNTGNGGGPWGQPPRGGGSGPGRNQPPDLEDLIRQGQQKFKRLFPGGGGRAVMAGALLVLVAGWLATGIYRVRDPEVGVILRFGKYAYSKDTGLGWHWPAPIETAIIENVEMLKTTEVGISGSQSRSRRSVSAEEESLMLTGDENIIDIDFTVNWRIDRTRVQDYLFNIREPDNTVKAVAESVMREVVGRNRSEYTRTDGRAEIQETVRAIMQQTLDDYGAGINIEVVNITQAEPPQQVIEDFRDVQAAAADRETKIEEARRYANERVQGAEGQAAQIRAQAEGYSRSIVAEAAGEGLRFLAIYDQYRLAPGVTRKRIYLETMERVLANKDKVIIDQNAGGQGVVPYLPLDRLRGDNN